MRDIQSEPSKIKLRLETVGITDVHFPITLIDRKKGKQSSSGIFSMYADLDERQRGIHMSRFMEVLNEEMDSTYLNSDNWRSLLKKLQEKLACKKITLEAQTSYFIEKFAPISSKASLLNVDVRFLLSLNREKMQKIVEITVPVTSLCPCSKEISIHGAHNQRSYVTLQVLTDSFIWIEDFVGIIESCASSPVYPLLKRPDEKFVTEKAYENPVFVEDMVRNISSRMLALNGIVWFCVRCKNLESIHDHNAFAMYEYGERDG